MAQTEALDIVMQQLLKSEYGLYGAHVSELRSDAKGVLGLRTACKQLAEHDARQWMGEVVFSIAENVELVQLQNPVPRYTESEVEYMMAREESLRWLL